MSLNSLADLVNFSKRPLPPGYPLEEYVKLYAPEDDIHGALCHLVKSAHHSVVIALHGFGDVDELGDVILRKMNDEHVYVSLTMASSTAAGKSEPDFLELAACPSNSVAFGRPTWYVQLVVDGVDACDWNPAEMTVIRHPVVAARARQRLDLTHESLLSGS